MNRLSRYIREYHPMVHILLIGTVFTFLTSSMSMPFLAIYLHQSTQLGPATIGLIIGAGPLAATLGGFFGGVLSDFLGRQRLMLLSLLVLCFVFVGFVYTSNPYCLVGLSILRGVSGAFFSTISKALMGDLTPEDKRFRMFANRYLAVNIGFSIGPMAGVLLGLGGSSFTFLLTAGIYFLYMLVLAAFFRLLAIQDSRQEPSDRITVAQAWQVIRTDTVLFLYIIGSVLLTTVHGQMSVTLSQFLEQQIVEGIKLFGLLMSINGVTVLVMQVPLTRWSERFSLFQRMVFGCLLFAAGEVGFAASTGWAGFIFAMIIFTLGEILVVPSEYAQIDLITPQGMRGTYYGAQGFSEFGNFLGPWAGGLVLTSYGGPVMFLMMAALSLISLIFYRKGQQLYQRKKYLSEKGEGVAV